MNTIKIEITFDDIVRSYNKTKENTHTNEFFHDRTISYRIVKEALKEKGIWENQNIFYTKINNEYFQVHLDYQNAIEKFDKYLKKAIKRIKSTKNQ